MAGYARGSRDRTVAALLSPEVAASLHVGSPSAADAVGGDPQRVLLDVGAELRIRAPSRFVDLFRSRVVRPVRVRRGRRTVAEKYDPLRVVGPWVVAPRGLVNIARDVAKRLGMEIDVRRSVRGEHRPLGDVEAIANRAGKPARPYQIEAAELLHDRVQGYVVVPCGGGKTWIGALAIAANGGPAVVVVGTVAQRTQWTDALRDAGVEVVTGGEAPSPGQAAVVLPGSVSPGVLATTEILLIDELHHLPASSWSAIAANSTARWRWGLTATPDRADGMGFLLDYVVGPRLLQVPHEHLIANGWIFRPALVPWSVAWEVPPTCREWTGTCSTCRMDASFDLDAFPRRCPRKGCSGTIPDVGLRPGRVSWTPTLSAWAASEALATSVEEILGWAVTHNRAALVLVPRVDVARSLAARLNAQGIRSAPLTGGQSDADRRIADLRRGRISALIGTTVADEALDLPELDLVVIASLGKAKGTHEQRAGRSTRPSGHRTPIVVDLVPDGVLWQWPARRRAFVGAFGGDVPAEPLPGPAAMARLGALHHGR